jgi:hypothetical protein
MAFGKEIAAQAISNLAGIDLVVLLLAGSGNPYDPVGLGGEYSVRPISAVE